MSNTSFQKIQKAKNAIKDAGLYLVSEKDIEKLSDVAMDAYENYPLHNWFSGGAYNKKASKLIMKISIKTMIHEGVIYADSEAIHGFAIWMPPGFTGSKTLPFLLNGGISLVLNSGIQIIGKLLNYESFAMNLKKKFTNHLDWYLYNLSVEKNSQGRGIASKLLQPMLQFVNEEQRPCYLETNKDSNVPLYKHFGFELQEESMIPNSKVKHYPMVRPSKSFTP